MDNTSVTIWLLSFVKRIFGVCAAVSLSFALPSYHAYRIPAPSMEPTLLIDDQILVRKIDSEIQRGDIVAFEAPAIIANATEKNGKRKIWLKRVLGLPGDRIEFRRHQLFLNGNALNEPYCVHMDSHIYPAAIGKIRNYQTLWESGGFAELRREQVGDEFGPILVPKDSYFVLGDNREGSYDSRYWGPLRRELIVGKAVQIYSPLSRAREL